MASRSLIAPTHLVFNDKPYYLAWYTGLIKPRAEQAKRILKRDGQKDYKIRIVKRRGAYYLYTRPRLLSEDSRGTVDKMT